ncbi:MAG TPA: aromatic ring-hydroxylating dioxygenase subunit alpha [Acidimicrobiales bacterium]
MTITSEPGTSAAAAEPGQARSSGLSYQELLDADTLPAPAVLRNVSPFYVGDSDKEVARYTDRRYHELEKEHLWSKVWQMACRDEDIPDVGDTLVYDIAGTSILLVRSSPDTVKAYYNACLHRGRQLRERDGFTNDLRCAFHGFCWNLDGSLKEVPCEWDFPQVRREEWGLPELKVGHWGGFVFVNMDPDCEPLEAFVGDLSSHFDRWPLENRYKAVHVAKIFPTNWKVVQEAFMEAFHVVATHPQLLPGIGDANSQYDAWGNFSRAITPSGTPSPHLKWVPTEQEVVDSMIDRRADEPAMLVIPEGMTARQVVGAGARRNLKAAGVANADELTDAELCDSIYYTLFPNFHPWGAYNRITYRFRPNGDRHDQSIMECMFLVPFVGERPPAVPVHWLGMDDPWTDAPELGMLAMVFTQDSYNLPKVQVGLNSMKKPGVTMGLYQETKLRHFHYLYEQWLGL